jgi:uncharacterized membrane protein
MPNVAVFHPYIVHFVIALLGLGVVLRLVSFTGLARFSGPAATALLLLGTLAAVAAVKSGTDAHGPVERMPGVRAAVQVHEEAGEDTRNVFLIVAGLEIAALLLARRKKDRIPLIASGLVGLVGLYFLYEAGKHGGDLVYSYAGGVGTRSGQPEDVGRLLLAGLYNEALLDRENGRSEQAASLIDTAVRRFPDDLEVRLLSAESTLLDRKDPAAALEALNALVIPKEESRLLVRLGTLKADALQASGQTAEARSTLMELISQFPNNRGLKGRLEELGQ